MKRRTFLLSSFLSGISSLPLISHAKLLCGPFAPPGVQQCEVGIDSSVAHITAAAVGGQHLSQWCWAACIEMVFSYYGHSVPQERIVNETWGDIVNLPGQPWQILANLNRGWTDEQGDNFSVVGDAYSANAITAAQDLAQDMPLIIGTMGHAMVLTSLVYMRDSFGRGDVTAAIVRDPWPGRGRRTLTPQEWLNINFAARIRVS
ncbi:papain-like cysteine protease family protein [Pseudomonas fluorescens]|uniref:papain-like cysteine protease family protein n=1 Tax=Pseudomonas fluorescens TaxID=294 RepID=UPI003D061C2F